MASHDNATALAQLSDALDETLQLLEYYGDIHWSTRLASIAQRLRQGDQSSLDQVHSVFGGMGSFNDLILSPVNGHTLKESESPEINRQLDQLRSRIYELTRQLRRMD